MKSRQLVHLLQGYCGSRDVVCVETYGWLRHPLRLLVRLLRESRKADVLIMLPAHKGVRVFAPVLYSLKRLSQKKIYYDVIGGWLPEYLEKKKILKKILQDFDGLWVESGTMKRKLEAHGFSNVSVIPNFRDIVPLEEKEMVFAQTPPLGLCTFSRVIAQKGIEDAVAAVEAVNNKLGHTAFTLDIYGQIGEGYEARFAQLQAGFPSYIRYCGAVAPEKSVETLKGYFALLFPTRYATEGVPGTVLDGYAAGVPVIASRWNSFHDVVEEGRTGFGYPFGDPEAMQAILLEAAANPDRILSKKKNCIQKAGQYQKDSVLRLVIQELEGTRN